MEFIIETVWFAEGKDVLNEYPILKSFVHKITEEGKLKIFFSDLQELIKFRNVVADSIIIHNDTDTIEIYDDWRG